MIHVLASIELKDGFREAFLEYFNSNVPKVLAEAGCIAYVPCVDVDTGIPIQELNANVVTIVEAWASVDHLNAHLAQPHMKDYVEKTAHMKVGTTIKVLEQG
jgi:quinol monooxygenase YgiN